MEQRAEQLVGERPPDRKGKRRPVLLPPLRLSLPKLHT